MRKVVLIALLLPIVLLLACPPNNTPQPVPPGPTPATGYTPNSVDAAPLSPPPDAEPLAAEGAACTVDADCESSICEGQGCEDMQGTCAGRSRMCTKDLRNYCGCDGNSFSNSGSCPGARYEFVGRCEDGKPDGAACQAGADCASGICEGQGCGPDAEGVCMAKGRGCTKDLKAYCGCDGKTFKGSGSCPGRRYQARGACSP